MLHQKQLDIICLQDKISICAECALFGLHKGHSFTTIKELEAKRNDWIHDISHIMEEKREFLEKEGEAQVEKEIVILLQKKRTELEKEVDRYYSKLRDLLE